MRSAVFTGNACPDCGASICPDDINVREGVAVCRACGRVSRLSDMAASADLPPSAADPSAPPPPGCSLVEDGADGTVVITASLRSAATAVWAFLFAAFWNGIVSMFVLVAAGGLYAHLFGPLPSWFPTPAVTSGGHGGAARTGAAMPLGEVLFLCVFLVPFVLIGAIVAWVAVVCVAGSVRITIACAAASVRTGVGPLSWTQRFDPARVGRVAVGQTSWTQNNRTKPLIVIEADREIKLGSSLTPERRAWMLGVLRAALLPDPRAGAHGSADRAAA